MNCHGHDTRVRIVENYNIKCTAHIRLLNEQIIRSDAERDITDTYYIFECVNKMMIMMLIELFAELEQQETYCSWPI